MSIETSIAFSKQGADQFKNQVPWLQEYLYLETTSQLTPEIETNGFKFLLSSSSSWHKGDPLLYLAFYRNTEEGQFVIAQARLAIEEYLRKVLKMPEPSPKPRVISAPTPPRVSFTDPDNQTTSRPPLPTRKSSSVLQDAMTKFRPLPFQYVWSFWHDSPSRAQAKQNNQPTPETSPTESNPSSTTPPKTNADFSNRLTILEGNVPDLKVFYSIWNNFPWEKLKLKDSIHIFRSGVTPLWEDSENINGGAFTMKIKREMVQIPGEEQPVDKALRAWLEICMMVCGGELQSELAANQRDHILGMSYSQRLYYPTISIWTKQGDNQKSIRLLTEGVIEGLAKEVRPQNKTDYYYKKHSEREGYAEAVSGVKK